MAEAQLFEHNSFFRKNVIAIKETSGLGPVGSYIGGFSRVRAYSDNYSRANPTQFDGTVTPPREVEVQLRLRGESYYLERTKSDETTGEFAFVGVYHELHDYEFLFIDHATDVKTIVPVSAPEYLRWNGNPHIYPMDGFTRL